MTDTPTPDDGTLHLSGHRWCAQHDGVIHDHDEPCDAITGATTPCDPRPLFFGEPRDYPASRPTTGVDLIATERQRQMDAEGWTIEHDVEHGRHQLNYAAPRQHTDPAPQFTDPPTTATP